MSLAPKLVFAERRVVTVRYVADVHGVWRPERPRRCSLFSEASPCKISFHRWRVRKCGPPHPLAGFYCATHECYFTGYPPSWLPFGRRPMVHVTPDDLEVFDVGEPPEAWVETAFGAAVDAAARRPWPKSAGGFIAWRKRFGREPHGVFRTQLRHMDGALVLFALVDSIAADQPAVAAALGIDLSDVVMAARRIRDGPAWRAKGETGTDLLGAVGRPRRSLLSGFIRLGRDRRYWGPPSTVSAG